MSSNRNLWLDIRAVLNNLPSGVTNSELDTLTDKIADVLRRELDVEIARPAPRSRYEIVTWSGAPGFLGANAVVVLRCTPCTLEIGRRMVPETDVQESVNHWAIQESTRHDTEAHSDARDRNTAACVHCGHDAEGHRGSSGCMKLDASRAAPCVCVLSEAECTDPSWSAEAAAGVCGYSELNDGRRYTCRLPAHGDDQDHAMIWGSDPEAPARCTYAERRTDAGSTDWYWVRCMRPVHFKGQPHDLARTETGPPRVPEDSDAVRGGKAFLAAAASELHVSTDLPETANLTIAERNRAAARRERIMGNAPDIMRKNGNAGS